MKTRFLQFTILAILVPSAPAQVITTPNPVVMEGQTIQLTADRPVKWSLAPGSAGTIDPGGVYRAPASVVAPHAMGGCQIGAPDSIFNTRIDNLPVLSNSAAWMAALPAPRIGFSPSWGTNVGDENTPMEIPVFNYTATYNGQPFQIPEWPVLKRESGVFSDPQSGVDRHILTVNRRTCRVYELYNNYPAGTAGNLPPANAYTAQSGWQYQSMSYGLPTDGATDAAGMPLAPTTLTLDDIRSGLIRHALRVTFGNSYIAPAFVWPATTHAGAFGFVPYGTRFRLRADFDITGFGAIAQVILRCLKQYGMIISDGGSNWDIVTSTDLTEDRDVQAAIYEIGLKNYLIRQTDMDIVDESALMVSPLSSQVAWNNAYVTPSAFAIARADDGTHTPVNVPIALQGVSLNSPEGGGIWIQSLVTKTLSVFVGGTTNTAVTWSMNPALGTLDAGTGVYVAPSVGVPTTTSITATSVADPGVSLTFPLTVLPAGPIRIVTGDATANPSAPNRFTPDYGPDSQNNMWWRDQAVERAWGVKNDYWYGSPWPALTDIYRYQTQYYNFGDTIYRFVVPNGKYNIDYYVSVGACGATNTYDPLLYREHLEAQGQIALHDFHPLATVDGKCYSPIHTTLPALVTDNNLYFSLRRITDHTQTGADQSPVTIISAFSVTPVSDAPHLTIDPAVPPALTMSQSVQLHGVGWFMGNSATWTVLSGPGTVDSHGLFTAPATPTRGTAVVQATSTIDGSRTATVAINLVFGTIVLAPGTSTLTRGATQAFTASIGGNTYSNVTWTISPAVGFINSAGVYTAPDVLATNTNVTVMATSNDDPAQTATAVITILASVPPIRVNCGGYGFTDSQGRIWAADYGFTLPSVSYGISGVSIAYTSPDMFPLYLSSHYVYENQSFSYNFPLPDGEYAVTLKFADYSFNDAPGFYDFDVFLNGAAVLTHFDPDSVHGTGRTAVDKTFFVFVQGKNLQITLTARKAAAFVNGIEILPANFFSKRSSGKTTLQGHTK